MKKYKHIESGAIFNLVSSNNKRVELLCVNPKSSTLIKKGQSLDVDTVLLQLNYQQI